MKEIANTTAVDFDPFQGPEIIRLAPSIEPQLEIWVACALGGEDANRAYNESVSLRLTGPFDFDAFRQALSALIARHEALRSSFSADGSKICIHRELTPQLYYKDITDLPAEDQQKLIKDFAWLDANTSFDLVNGPLFRTSLFTIGEATHYLTLSGHHLVCDGWSLGILMQDLGKLYTAYSKGSNPALPEPVQISAFAVRQWEFSQSSEYRAIESYWLNQYRSSVPVLDMPTDFPRPAIRTYKSRRDDYALDTAMIAAVKKTGASAGCSLVITLLAGFEILLHRYTRQDDIVLGLPAAGQSATGDHSLIGHCVNLLPLRSHPSGEQTILQYLRSRKPAILDDLDHQLLTFGSLLQKLSIQRDPSRIPLVPVAFNIDMGMDNGVSFHHLRHQLIYNPRAFENFELFLNASGSESSFVLEWSYNTQLFKPETIAGLMEAYTQVLSTMIENPHCRIADIPIFPEPEIALHGLDTPFPRTSTVTELFEAQVSAAPDKIALVFEDQVFTYRELDEASSRMAQYLRHKGVVAETLVPLCIRRSPDLIISILGILKAGGAYVPIDPEYPLERVRFMLEDVAAGFLLADNDTAAKLPKSTNCEIVIFEEIKSQLDTLPAEAPAAGTNASSLAYIIYTSGSTGRPKGAMIVHSNITSLVKASDYVQFDGTEVILSTGSPSFDATTFEYWGTLLNGGALVMPSEQALLDINLLKQAIRTNKVNRMWITSSLLNQWISLDISLLQGLRTVLAGGEKLSEKHLGLLRNAYPSLVIINGYGPTENTTFSLTYTMAGDIPAPIPIGRPLSNRSAYILDAKGRLCRPGEMGELFVGGAGVCRGYLNRPELTAERFLPDPFDSRPGARMYRTGDLARWQADGNVEYLGRIDDQVKIRGYRIELGEIETILGQCPGIKDTVVTAHEDKRGDKRLVGYIVPEGTFDKAAVLSWLSSKLPEYMVPRQWIPLERIPLTANGKADKRALPNPDQTIVSADHAARQPQTEIQKTIAAIFCEVLGKRSVGLDEDFFELGGHSLKAIQVMKQLEERTGQRLPITTLFSAPSVESLSALLDTDRSAISWKSLVPIKPEGTKPPLYIVHGSGLTVLVFNSLARSLSPDQPVFGLQAHGFNGETPFDTIEEIAGFYITEILAQNPSGPYNLGGYSFGGIVAFEMARQLTAMGKQINTLAIFDTNADNSDHHATTGQRWKKKIFRQLPKFRFVTRSFFKHPMATLQYQRFIFNSRIRGIFEAAGWLKPRPTEEEILSPYANKINDSHYRALFAYQMQTYSGSIDLFRVTTRLYYLDDPIYLGWKPYAQKGVRIHDIPGDHKTFLLDPNYKILANLLQETLDEKDLPPPLKLEVVRPTLKIV